MCLYSVHRNCDNLVSAPDQLIIIWVIIAVITYAVFGDEHNGLPGLFTVSHFHMLTLMPFGFNPSPASSSIQRLPLNYREAGGPDQIML